MNGLALASGVLLVLACAASGSAVLLHHARALHAVEAAYGIHTPYLRYIAAGTGAATGLCIGGILLYFLALGGRFDAIEWVGRLSYVLVAGASGGHLLVLVRAAALLWREERGWGGGGARRGTLGHRRIRAFEELQGRQGHYLDLKARDDRVVDELVGVLGTPLLHLRRDLSRIPFYGYLGTVCGILLMAQELGKIDAASETFKVLSSMATGLVLAFQTTLVALLAYLPLRKAADYLIQRLGALEDRWSHWRDEREAR